MPKILLADVDKNMRTFCRGELDEEGYEIRTAADAQEALRQFRSDRPDLVILDIRIPALTDGLELLSRMMSLDNRVPVILFSTCSFYLDSFVSWSADALVPKSTDLSELKGAIRYYLYRHAPQPVPNASLLPWRRVGKYYVHRPS